MGGGFGGERTATCGFGGARLVRVRRVRLRDGLGGRLSWWAFRWEGRCSSKGIGEGKGLQKVCTGGRKNGKG